MTKKKIYLASPLGFSESSNMYALPRFVTALELLGLEVYEPFQRNNQVDFADPEASYIIGQKDLADVRECDAIFAIVNGNPPDEGVMIELGYAMALNKKIFLFRDDFRKCSDGDKYPLNLMVFSGLPQHEWQKYYYTSIFELHREDMGLYQWSQE